MDCANKLDIQAKFDSLLSRKEDYLKGFIKIFAKQNDQWSKKGKTKKINLDNKYLEITNLKA